MKIRDAHATHFGVDKVIKMPSGGIDIVADDGRPLFSISIDGNELHVDGGMVCKHEEVILDNRFIIKPVAANCVKVIKVPYEN